jgi:apolipoprotein N-acyltransferase
MKSFIPMLLSFIAGGLYALSYPSFLGFEFFPFLFLGLFFFLRLLGREEKLSRILALIFFYNLGLNVFGFYWIPQTLREFGQLPYVVSLVLGLLFSLILQPHWWFFGLWKKYRMKFPWSSSLGILLTATILMLLERYTPQQFPIYAGSPWLFLAPYLGLAPYFGVSLFSFMTYWSVLELVNQREQKTVKFFNWGVLSLFLILNLTLSLKNPPSGKDFNVRIVQANIGNFLKVSSEKGDSESFDSINRTYAELSVPQNNFHPDMIVWPETAYSTSFHGRENPLPPLLVEIMKTENSEMLIGGYDQDTTKSPFDFFETVYNSALLLSTDRIKTAYHKNILIPFGETLPLGPLNKTVAEIVPAISLFARGHGTPIMETRDRHRFVTPICYEILNSEYMRDLLNEHGGNSFILNLTNDSWYGNTAEPHQHQFLSKWRALEFQLPIIRSTNTGISSVIFPDGSESKRMDVGEKNFLDVPMKVSKIDPTLYQSFGILPLLALIFTLALITWRLGKNGTRL